MIRDYQKRNCTSLLHLEVCKIYWMAPFVDEFYNELIINDGQLQLLSDEIIWDMIHMTDTKELFRSYGVNMRDLLDHIDFSQIENFLMDKPVPFVLYQQMLTRMPFNVTERMNLKRASQIVNIISRTFWECSRKSAWMTTVGYI